MKSGFTLAETLITLGIIGIVAALTIPILAARIGEKRTVSQLRETYSILSQALKLAQEEYGEVANWGMTGLNAESATLIANNFKPFLKVAVDCGVDDTNNHCSASSYTYKNSSNTIRYDNAAFKYKILLMNGSSVFFNPVGSSKLQINIDVNGIAKPNIIGKDVFLFYYDENGLFPMGSKNSLYPYETSCLPKNSNGTGCAYYVLTYENMDYL